ncbi:MAG: spore cortex biosynthesis protein YabQ [Lachnospiraceae bacterium]|nr:spore cortex biosynthesis protein YabQ [Lachnospiraceae bacterium]
MSGEIVREWHFWLISIATGVCMAFAYDVLRLFRRLVRHGRFAVDLEDILYWTACFGLSFTLLYYGNNGVIRFAAVLGAAVGMLIYAATVGRFFVKISFWIIDKTVGSLFRIIGKGIKGIRKLLRPVKCFATVKYDRLRRRLIRIFQRIQLTRTTNRHKMKEYRRKDAKDGKEAADGRKINKRKKKCKKTKKKDAGVSPGEK